MARPMWVFVVGMYRTGSTTQYLLTEGVVEITENGQGIGYHTEDRLQTYERYNGNFVVCKVFKPVCESSQTAKVIKQDGRMRAIATVRDPRDIVTSMKKRGVNFSWKDTMKEWPTWQGWFLKWASYGDDIIRIVKYEDMIRDLEKEVRGIANFLGIQISPEQVKEVAKLGDLTYQRERAKKAKDEGKPAHPWLPSLPGAAFGKARNWPSVLTLEEKRDIEAKARLMITRWRY